MINVEELEIKGCRTRNVYCQGSDSRPGGSENSAAIGKETNVTCHKDPGPDYIGVVALLE